MSIKHGAVVLKVDFQRNGYQRVYLWKDGQKKNLLVHRLVAEAFLPNPLGYSDINHLDEDKTNNTVSNLQWCTHLYNMNYGSVKRKISEAHRGKKFCPERLEQMRAESSSRGWINNGSQERFAKFSEFPSLLNEGWSVGRTHKKRSEKALSEKVAV